MGSEFPGFEDDAPPAKAAKPAATPGAAPPNPFAQQQVEVPGAITAPPPPKTAAPPNPFAQQVVAVPGKPTAAPATRPAPRPPAAAPEADVQPGSGKDLWTCPHCQVRNKPERKACRACGKAPGDATVAQRKGRLIVVGAVVVLALGLVLYFALAKTDLSLHPAGAAGLDRAARQTRATAVERDLGNARLFSVDGKLAVSGRVLIARPFAAGAGYVVALALGKDAGDDAAFAGMKGMLRESTIEVEGARAFVCLHLLFTKVQKPELKRGDYLSLVGERGVLTESTRIVGDSDLGPTVLVEAIELR